MHSLTCLNGVLSPMHSLAASCSHGCRSWPNSSRLPLSSCAASKRPSQLLPPAEDKLMHSMVETGIRGSLAMVAASALHLDVFSHLHLQLSDAVTGLQLAAPCVAIDTTLALLHNRLQHQSTPQGPSSSRNTTLASLRSDTADQTADRHVDQAQQPPTVPQQPSGKSQAGASLAVAVDAVYLHNIRYSLLGAAPAGPRLLLESGAQLSEELLARGVLLGSISTWINQRFVEAGVCDDPTLLALDSIYTTTASTAAPSAATTAMLTCGTGAEWLAAAALCCIMASRFEVHSRDKADAANAAQEAAAAEAATRRALLRYEPLAVQEAAAAAEAAAAGSNGSSAGVAGDLAAAAAAAGGPAAAGADPEVVGRLVHAWLGARFVLGQASMFVAFILTDNLLASFVAGLAMQLVSTACSERYLDSRAPA